MPYANNKYTAMFLGFAIIIVLWTAHVFSFFSSSNGSIYDLLLRSSISSKASKQIIVIEMDSTYSASENEIWMTLLNQLLKYDVKQIAFTFLPDLATEQFYQLAINSGKTVFGVPMAKHPMGSNLVESLLPRSIENKKIVYGLISPPPGQNGVYRKQHSTIKISEINYPGFEKRVAQSVLAKTRQLPNSDFLVNFIGKQNRIPRLSVERVLTGGLINELVSGRTVLVGINEHATLSQFFTPLSSNQQLTSDVMFHAFALDTLLSDRQISTIPDWAFFLLIAFITFISLFYCQWLSFQMSFLVSTMVTVILLILDWFFLHLLYNWISLVELLLAQWLSFAIVWAYRIAQENKNLDLLLIGLSSKLREKVMPASFYDSAEPWEQLVVLINQSLNLNRLIFLEPIQGAHRLKEIKALNCSIDDINELRRDFERTPYSTAIAKNEPILLTQPYLKEVDTVEIQYLAPLIFAGEVLGFWAFTIDHEKVKSKKFKALSIYYMQQISELLHYRQEWQKRLQFEQSSLSGYLRIEGGSRQLNQLNQYVTLLDRRDSELQEVFNSIHTRCILYDLFGRVLLLNNNMEEFAQQVDLRLFNMTMLEFIIEITAYDESDARNLLQQIIYDNKAISLPISHKQIKQSFMLNIRSLFYRDKNMSNELVPDETNVFNISGVLCELVDSTKLKELYQLKEQMFERFNFQIRNDLSSILFSLPTLEDTQVDQEEKQIALESIQTKVDETLKMLDFVQQQMDVETDHMLSDSSLCYPMNGKAPLQYVTKQLQATADQHDITIHLKLPELISLVFASPLELEIVLDAILQTIIEDTYESGDIWIEMGERDQQVFYQIQNKGIGISDYILEQFEETKLTEEPEIIKLHNAIQCINSWGGSLNISSQMGEGSKAELLLKSFV